MDHQVKVRQDNRNYLQFDASVVRTDPQQRLVATARGGVDGLNSRHHMSGVCPTDAMPAAGLRPPDLHGIL